MAKSLGMDSQKPGVSTELRDRLLFVVLALLVYRIGSHIPVPGINTVRLDQLMEQQKDTVIGLFNMFSGHGLSLRRKESPGSRSFRNIRVSELLSSEVFRLSVWPSACRT